MKPLVGLLKRLADECTVKITSGEVTGGSGFFVASGVVMTCAHVVATQNGQAAPAVQVEWGDGQRSGNVRATPSAWTGTGLWPYPDLCVIELDDTFPGHPWVMLGDVRDSETTDVYFGGFNNVYSELEGLFQGAKSARLDEPQKLPGGGQVWQLAGCEIPPGMSGAPLLDLHSGLICGVVKTQRRENAPHGGLAIPGGAIREHYPDIWARNQQANGHNGQWMRLRAAIAEAESPVQRLTAQERQGLAEAGRELGLRPAELHALWEELAGPFKPPLARPLNGIEDLLAELADLTVAEGDLDPVVRLFERLAVQRRLSTSDRLHEHASSIAARLGQVTALSDYRVVVPGAGLPDSAESIFVVRVDVHAPGPTRKFLPRIWCYPAHGGLVHQVPCLSGPHSERNLEKAVVAALTEAIPDLPAGDITIEFVLPDHLLDRPVEKWEMENGSLGVDYRVVVRFAQRTDVETRTWRSRGQDLRGKCTPPAESPSWFWVSCRDPRDFRQLAAALQVDRDLPLIGMSSWRQGKRVTPPLAVRAARHAGIPVLVWRHDNCSDHDSGTPCIGKQFQLSASSALSGIQVGQLPEEIRKLRAKAAAGREDPASPGHCIAVLWDDPRRVPWAQAAKYQAPGSPGTGDPAESNGE